MIFTYIVRSIFAQRSSSLLSIVVLAAMTSITLVLLGFVHGLVMTAKGNADPLTAVVTVEGAPERGSHIAPATENQIEVSPDIAREGGQSLFSPELVAVVPVDAPGVGILDEIPFRGVTPRALLVHRRVHINGHLPAPGEPGVVIGAGLIGRYPGYVLGGKISVRHKELPIVGTLDARDSPFESEMWADRAYLKQLLHREADGTVYVRLTSADAQASFKKLIEAMRGTRLRAYTELEFYQKELKALSLYFGAVYLIVFVLVGAMVVSSANTIYTSFLGRTRELATLMAIGFSRRRVMLMMTTESLLLTLFGSVVGMALAMIAQGYRVPLEAEATAYAVRISPEVLVVGVAIGAATGLLASLVANVQVSRIDVMRGLRE